VGCGQVVIENLGRLDGNQNIVNTFQWSNSVLFLFRSKDQIQVTRLQLGCGSVAIENLDCSNAIEIRSSLFDRQDFYLFN